MKKFQLKYVVVALVSSGCVTFGSSDYKSQWKPLLSAEKISCIKWPKTDEDIKVTGVKFFSTEKGDFFFSESVARSGASKLQISKFSSDRPPSSPDDLVTLNWSKSVLLGVIESGNGQVALTASEDEEGAWEIDLIKLSDNKVIGKTQLSGKDLVIQEVALGLNRAWITYQYQEKDESEALGLVAMTIDSNTGKIVAQDIKKIAENGDIHMMSLSGSSNAIILGHKNITQNGKEENVFIYQFVDDKGKLTPPKTLSLDLKEGVEKWNMVVANNKLFLVLVKGDSMVGESKVGMVELSLSAGSDKITVGKPAFVDANDKHLAMPLVSTYKSKYAIILPTWLDYESTIELYEFGAAQPKYLGTKGVFKEESAVLDVFEHKHNNSVWAIVKRQEGLVFNYELCRLL